MITAKVRVANQVPYADSVAVTFYADYADGRNKEWAYATPSLNLTMTMRPEVAELFKDNTPYTLQFVESTDEA